nr:LysR-family transcriptional regulatory protein [Kibdelosporangium sp. MJ126-NF4]CTQ97467.1 LysR-family transcriptional regulatory protein [Kibdelosporangium sp. MJ126-NF4]
MEAFLVLADELNLDRTAERLRVTQGRIGQLIRSLERQIGAALVEHTGQDDVVLTDLGTRFHEGARRGFDVLSAAMADCQAAARDTQVRLSIGYMPSIGAQGVTRIVSAFEHRHPGCVVHLRAMVNFDVGASGYVPPADTDVELIWSPGGDGKALDAPGRTIGPVLHRVGRGVIVPSGHPLAEFESISVEQLSGYALLNPSNSWRPELVEAWTPSVTPSGAPLNRLATDIPELAGRRELTLDDFLTAVARGHGLHVTIETVFDRMVFPGLEVVPIHDMPPMAVVPIWRSSSRNTAIRAFVDTARDISFDPGP